jgi:hypothetical protein
LAADGAKLRFLDRHEFAGCDRREHDGSFKVAPAREQSFQIKPYQRCWFATGGGSQHANRELAWPRGCPKFNFDFVAHGSRLEAHFAAARFGRCT